MSGLEPAEYAALDATALAALVRDAAVSPDEVLAAATAAHEAVCARLNAVLEWYEDPRRRVAAPEAPFGGVPALRKDFGAAEAGRLVERGSRLSVGYRAAHTDPLIDRFRRSGLVLTGRAAVPEFILHATTESRVHGVTRNPWNPATSAGGSSGGSAAAVAAGVVPLAHASDCAGSIRIPASVCGLVGLKPSRGRVPWGDGRGRSGGWGGIAEEFVVARSVRDVQTALAAVGRAGTGLPAPGDGPLSIAVVSDHWAGAGADPVLVDALARTAATAAALGHRADAAPWPVAYERVATLVDPLFGGGAVDALDATAAATGRPLDAEHLEPVTLAYLEVVRAAGPGARRRAAAERVALTAELDRWWDRCDVVVSSTLGRASLPLGLLGGEVPFADWTAANDLFTPHSFVANLAGWPALSIPWGRGPDGVPIGIQLLGPRGSDELLLSFAAALEAAAPPLGRPLVWPAAPAPPGARRSGA